MGSVLSGDYGRTSNIRQHLCLAASKSSSPCIPTGFALALAAYGMRDRKVTAAPEREFFLLVLGWGLLGIVGIMPFSNCHPFWSCVLLVLWLIGLAYPAYRLDRRRRVAEDVATSAAVEEWDRLMEVDTIPGQNSSSP